MDGPNHRVTRILRQAAANPPFAREATSAVLTALPPDSDLDEVAGAVATLIDRNVDGSIYRQIRSLPAVAIRRLVDHPKLPRDRIEVRVLAAYAHGTDGSALEARWRAGIDALEQVVARPLRSAAFRKRLRAAADNPELVHALQTAITAGFGTCTNLLAVLAVEGSEASCAAMAATLDTGELPYLADVLAKVGADTPAIKKMLRDVEAARRRRSCGLRVLAHLGLDAPKLFLALSLRADADDARLGIQITDGFSVHLTRGSDVCWFHETTHGYDDLELGRCDVLGIPTWIAAAADRLNLPWTYDSSRTNLRGAARTRLFEWLLP